MIDEYAVVQEKYAAALIEIEAAEEKLFIALGALIEIEAAEEKLFIALGGTVLQDGNMFGALIGENIQEGCCAFEDTRWGALHKCLQNYRHEKPQKPKVTP